VQLITDMDLDFYTEFENKFRGSREQIKDVLSNYDGLVDYILSIDKEPTLLDIGSGRGEWIEKCNEKGFKSIGIELDSKMVIDCRNMNLNIKEGDALSLLDGFCEDSFSIVSAFHVIEHMSHENIKELLLKSQRVLKSDGLLILETPSIDSLLVATKSFHLDPTHINAIHPDLLDFMVKRAGFNKSKYYFINGGPLQKSDHVKLTRVLNGVAQDLVLVASKSNNIDKLIFNDSNFIKRDMRLAKTTLDAAIDFDHYMMNQFAQYDEAIFFMRKRILELERQLENYIRINNRTSSNRFIHNFNIVKTRILSLKFILKKIIKTLFLRFIRSKIYRYFIKRVYNIDNLFFIIRFLEKKLDKAGFRIYQYKFVKKSKKIKEDIQLTDKHNMFLENYFETSKDAKNIFSDLKKYSKL
tara:strand:+ start:458 stop:1693 length:1236 start_codon:yes stop_codon:yes gene_type:complete